MGGAREREESEDCNGDHEGEVVQNGVHPLTGSPADVKGWAEEDPQPPDVTIGFADEEPWVVQNSCGFYHVLPCQLPALCSQGDAATWEEESDTDPSEETQKKVEAEPGQVDIQAC